MTNEIEPVEGTPAVEDTTLEDDKGTPNREAAKYRLRAKEAESARDELATQLDSARSQIVEAALTGSSLPVTLEALTAAGVSVTDLFEDGKLDTTRLGEAVKSTAGKFGIKRPSAAPFVDGMNRVTLEPDGPNWEGAFAPKNRRKA